MFSPVVDRRGLYDADKDNNHDHNYQRTRQNLKYKDDEKKRLEDELKNIIKKDHMGKFYKQVCKDLKWAENKTLSKELEEENKNQLKKLEVDIKDEETNLGESELREALLAKAEYLTKIGDKDAAIEAVRKTMEKTVGLGNRMDLVFHNIRVGLFYMDHELIRANLDKANQLLEEGGDWDRRNRLKVSIMPDQSQDR